jgi:hypothetical protein
MNLSRKGEVSKNNMYFFLLFDEWSFDANKLHYEFGSYKIIE